MKKYDRDCTLCRMMRALSLSGLGMGLGAAGAYFLGASKENMVYTGMVVATILVFGSIGRTKVN